MSFGAFKDTVIGIENEFLNGLSKNLFLHILNEVYLKKSVTYTRLSIFYRSILSKRYGIYDYIMNLCKKAPCLKEPFAFMSINN